MSKRHNQKPVAAQPAVPLPMDSEKQPPDVPIWECPNCGQNYFGTQPPDLCAYCQDYTTWRRVRPDEPSPGQPPDSL